jgi:hypothetical protein
MKDYHINIFYSDADEATSQISRISRCVRLSEKRRWKHSLNWKWLKLPGSRRRVPRVDPYRHPVTVHHSRYKSTKLATHVTAALNGQCLMLPNGGRSGGSTAQVRYRCGGSTVYTYNRGRFTAGLAGAGGGACPRCAAAEVGSPAGIGGGAKPRGGANGGATEPGAG